MSTAIVQTMITWAMIVWITMFVSMTPAQARTSANNKDAPTQLAQHDDIGASAAAAAASAASGGRVLDVKRQSSRTGIMYRVKVLLPGGRVRTMTVDGQSGQVRG